MMIECPKCGFIQPRDKFCAKCGVDVERFEPQKPPLYQRLLKNTVVQVIIAVCLVSAMLPTIYLHHSSQQEEFPPEKEVVPSLPSQGAPSKTKLSNKALGLAKKSPVKPLPHKGQMAAKKPSKLLQPSASVESEKQVAAAGVAIVSGKTNKKKRPEIPPEEPRVAKEVHVRFAEVPQASLNDIVFKNSLLGDDGYLRAGAYKLGKRLSQITQKVSGLSFLPGTRSKKLPMSQDEPMTFQFIHAGEGGQDYGLHLKVYSHLNSGDLTVELDGEINLRSVSGENMVNSPLQSSYTLPQNEVLFIELTVLPPQPMDETHMSSLSGTPLSIMSRTDFLEGQTSLVILVQTR